MDVGENASYAEISHLGDPAWNIEPGDRLALLPEEQGGATVVGADVDHQRDPMTGLLRHSDFLAKWAEEREQCEQFALALVRLAPRGAANPSLPEAGEAAFPEQESRMDASLESETLDDELAHPGQLMAEAARFLREEAGRHVLGGRYGLNSLVFFHPHTATETVAAFYERLLPDLSRRLGLEAAVGIARHPYLDFRKSDALENSRKALEYAMLLPHPHVGVLDSLALNISADKRFSQGDAFGAIKEYQLALLADESNGIAWNSLGICLAGIGRHAEAERHFTRALACRPGDPMALYNLGYMHQSQNSIAAARERYAECLEHAPDHLYALVRLGQLHEIEGDTASARSLYEKAAKKTGGESLTRRHFARLCIAEGKLDEAREHLHEALLHDPQDALAMQMLARLYLDAGEDPDMAASLARQSVSLRPEFKSGWLELARALDAMGQTAHAREARLKAM
jgi:tetratricopeptide (TPR) repeat protein